MDRKEKILNNEYKYVYDEALQRYRHYYRNKPMPLRPKKMYKYYALNLNNVAALHDGYFWLSNPADFNDPFDCNLHLVEHENIEELNNKVKRANDVSNIGVTCFSEVLKEPLMWGHYTNNYKGFVVEFNPLKTTVQLDATKRKHSLNPVMYFSKFIKVKNTDSFAMEYLLTAKSKKWKYEREWRFISTIHGSNERVVFYERHSVKALYIGHRIPDQDRSAYTLLLNIYEEKYPGKPVYVVYPNPQRLELVFEKVQ
jgi:hypothetical protein